LINKSIQIRDLEFRYPQDGFRLRVPQLDIERGEKVALIGRSGCGKTTLAYLIAGILSPTTGRITVGGRDITGLHERERRAFRIASIGFVFQDFELLDYLPARDNLLLPYTVNRTLTLDAAARERANAIAASVGLADKLDRLPAQLSGGERQRLAIARALVTAPKLIIADEPTGNLDPDTASEVVSELLARSADATVLTITHDHSLLPLFDTTIDVGTFSHQPSPADRSPSPV